MLTKIFDNFRECAAKAIRGISRMARSRANRRNTMDCAILNQIFIDDDTKKANDKRSMHLLRESERDSKLSSMAVINSASYPVNAPVNNVSIPSINNVKSLNKAVVAFEERKEGYPVCRTQSNTMSAVPKLIESCNRYMSVTSRPIGCRSSAPASAFILKDSVVTDENSVLKSRQEYHESFSSVVKLGSSDKQDGKVGFLLFFFFTAILFAKSHQNQIKNKTEIILFL